MNSDQIVNFHFNGFCWRLWMHTKPRLHFHQFEYYNIQIIHDHNIQFENRFVDLSLGDASTAFDFEAQK